MLSRRLGAPVPQDHARHTRHSEPARSASASGTLRPVPRIDPICAPWLPVTQQRMPAHSGPACGYQPGFT